MEISSPGNGVKRLWSHPGRGARGNFKKYWILEKEKEVLSLDPGPQDKLSGKRKAEGKFQA